MLLRRDLRAENSLRMRFSSTFNFSASFSSHLWQLQCLQEQACLSGLSFTRITFAEAIEARLFSLIPSFSDSECLSRSLSRLVLLVFSLAILGGLTIFCRLFVLCCDWRGGAGFDLTNWADWISPRGLGFELRLTSCSVTDLQSFSLVRRVADFTNSPVPFGLSSVNNPRYRSPSLRDAPMPSFLLSWKKPSYSSPLLRHFRLPQPCFRPPRNSPSQNYTPSSISTPFPSRRLFTKLPSKTIPALTSIPLPFRTPCLKFPTKFQASVECRPWPLGSPPFQLPTQYWKVVPWELRFAQTILPSPSRLLPAKPPMQKLAFSQISTPTPLRSLSSSSPSQILPF